ncbi:hypothetical protein ACJ72_04873 [Emergomyces africanus]|uniref:Uncharacterized protein n=1 Tax=Emergomyces africanus TaxID=1955775 RepID=A0A1B7NVY7_9EURO|nr:hypothetical protein ACJ72_04873 [Emergomyces africanus]
MTSSSQTTSAEGHIMEGESPPVILANDESGLSPMSKKILDKCAIPVTPVTTNFSITPALISRPSISGLDTGEFSFHFAKPKLPTPNFTSRLKTKLDGGMTATLNNPGVTLNTPETGRPDIKLTDSGSRGSPAHLNEEDASSRRTSPPRSPVAKRTAKILCEPNAKPSSEETACILEDGYRASGQSETDTPEQGSYLTDVNDLKSQGDLTRATPKACTPSPASSHHDIGEPKPPSARPLTKDAGLRPKLLLNPKVTKRSISPRLGLNRSAARQVTPGPNPSFPSQLSEQDLFYMLILRLKKRDEVDAETTAMREQMEGEMIKLTRANDTLLCKLRESDLICKNQKGQLTARNSLVERWKVKFSKLRAVVTSVGTEFAGLRMEGQRLKSMQDSLFQEKEQIRETLKQINSSTDQLKTRWSQHRANITDAKQECNSLEKSLLIATTKITDTEKLISMERNRVATLENYIKNYSHRHQAQAAEIEQKQSHTITKIDAIHKHLEGSWNFSQSSFKNEIESGFSSGMSLLKLLSERQTVIPQDLEKVDRAIRDLSTQLNSSIEASNKTMETAVERHTNYGQRISTQLTDLDTAVRSGRAVVDQLAEARELYGGFQEKLHAVEKNLAEVSADRDRLMSQEADLQRHIGDLKIEISSLQRNEIENNQFKDADKSSELQIQLGVTSAALDKVTAEFKAKESETHEMELKLAETIEKLRAAEYKIANLQSENFNLQEEARKTEHKVREELTKANLAAKDQHRAWFEQERHKLTREKTLAENNAQKAIEELDAVKCSLQAMEKRNHDLTTKMNQRQAEINSMKMAASNRDSDVSTEVDEVKVLHASTLKELQSARGQLEAVAKEKEELTQQLSESRINLDILQEQETLRDTLKVLQYEVAEKDINLLSMREELSKSEESNQRALRLEQEVADKSAEIAILREKLNNTWTSDKSIVKLTKGRSDEIVEGSGEFPIAISTLQQNVERKDNELAELKSRLQEANHIFEKVENILKQLGFIGTAESLRDCSNVLQSRFEIMVGDPGVREVKEHTESRPHISTRASSKRQRTSRKRTISSSYAECVGTASSTRERQTTELVYRTQSTREIISPTLKTPSSRQKSNINNERTMMSGAFIRPSSQLQTDTAPQVVYLREPTFPMPDTASLNALFPSTSMGGINLGASQALTAVDQNAPPIEKASLFTIEKDIGKDRNDLSISNVVNDVISASRRAREPRLPKGPLQLKVPFESKGTCEAMGNEHAQKTNAPSRRGDVTNGVETQPISGFRTSACILKTKEMPKDEMHAKELKVVQKPPEKLSPKGILKDTTKSAPSTEENAVQTPPHENKGDSPMGANSKIACRRPSRRSKYFNPTFSPAASITARGRYGSTANKACTPTGRARERPRRRPRGDPYHNRFSQKPHV